MTNYERIKAMSIDEMARFIFGTSVDYDDDDLCGLRHIENILIFDEEDDIKYWLESEVEVYDEGAVTDK